MSKIKLEIVTPERKVYSDEVEMVIARAAGGDIGVLPHHAPMVSPLKPTVVRIMNDGKEDQVAVSGGFLEVRPEQITILAETAERPEDIDVARAERAKERAEKRITEGEGDVGRAQAALARALNRLTAIGKLR